MNKLTLHKLSLGNENDAEEKLPSLSDEELQNIDHKELQVSFVFCRESLSGANFMLLLQKNFNVALRSSNLVV